MLCLFWVVEKKSKVKKREGKGTDVSEIQAQTWRHSGLMSLHSRLLFWTNIKPLDSCLTCSRPMDARVSPSHLHKHTRNERMDESGHEGRRRRLDTSERRRTKRSSLDYELAQELKGTWDAALHSSAFPEAPNASRQRPKRSEGFEDAKISWSPRTAAVTPSTSQTGFFYFHGPFKYENVNKMKTIQALGAQF